MNESCKLLNGDAYELIKTIPDNSIDLIVTDPPYLIEHTKVQSEKWEKILRIQNCFTQLEKANMIARKNGWTPFISIQNHYNLIYREEEREMMQLLEEEKMVMTPYSVLAAGRLCRLPEEESERSKDDTNSNFKYDHCKDVNKNVIKRVKEVADKMKISMTLVSLG